MLAFKVCEVVGFYCMKSALKNFQDFINQIIFLIFIVFLLALVRFWSLLSLWSYQQALKSGDKLLIT